MVFTNFDARIIHVILFVILVTTILEQQAPILRACHWADNTRFEKRGSLSCLFYHVSLP